MSTSPGITLCLITKDEERFITDAIVPLLDVCDSTVVVDTGSTDRTIELAKELSCHVLERPFEDDFSDARNAALDYVQTDWVLFIDADEQFEPSQAAALPELLATVDEDVLGLRVLRYNFFPTGGFYVSPELKLFRNRPDVRYRRKINESVAESIAEAGGRIELAPVLLNHFGHTRPVAAQRRKAAFYIDLMEAQLVDNPADAILHAYIALILRTLGRFEEALERSERALALQGDWGIIWFFRGHVLRASGDERAALDAYDHAVSLESGDATFWNMVGVTCLALGDLERAEESFRTALRLQPLLAHVHINLGFVAQARGDLAQAGSLFTEAARQNPAFLRQEWQGVVEYDPYRPFYYETVLGYAGLSYHLAHCERELRLAGGQD